MGGHGSVSDEIKNSKSSNAPPTVRSISEEGVRFKSYRDGSEILLTPESSIELQIDMGADLIVNFDECTPFHISRNQTVDALERTNRWQSRGLKYFKEHSINQGLYGVVQGSVYPDLRQISMEYCNSHDYFGYAIGGSLGCNLDDMHSVLQVFQQHKLPSRPVHLLGMGGKVREIFESLKYGIDTFDCVHPTRIARHGFAICPAAINPKGALNITNSAYMHDLSPIDPDCTCPTCAHYTRGALHTLIRAREFTGLAALTTHNVATMVRLMREIRDGIEVGTLGAIRKHWVG
jgi:queuine tRNA-ribosyltransferase